MIAKLWNKAWGQRWNPIYQSGSLAIFFVLTAIVSGLILILFYRIGDPYASVAAINANPILSIIRSIHRYSSDACVLAVIVHAIKMAMSSRAFGPRSRSWITGIILLWVILAIGITGLILVWDQQAQRLAQAGIRMLELLPIFSEPPRRIFADQLTLGSSFFFMLVFMHMALPLTIAALLWVHTARVSRPIYLPEKSICYLWTGVLVVGSIILPAALDPAADLGRLPGRTHLDLWYSFLLPIEEAWGGLITILSALTATVLLALYSRTRKAKDLPAPAIVDNNLCTGCAQCVEDCPYEAITMVKRPDRIENDRRSELVALVDSDACVSCGICIASCKPMAIGPPDLTGKDQLRKMKETLTKNPIQKDQIVVMGCVNGCGMSPKLRKLDGIRLLPTPCTGSLHTSVMELILRQGALGVMIATCPERDCTNREGPKWLEERIYNARPAELMGRVDRKRIRIVHASSSEVDDIAEQAIAFLNELRNPDHPPTQGPVDAPKQPETPQGEKLSDPNSEAIPKKSASASPAVNGKKKEAEQSDPALIP